MTRTYGCAPVYFTGATLFFIGGGLFIYYDRPVIGSMILIPGLMLLGLTLFAWATLSRIKSGNVDVNIVVRDKEGAKQLSRPRRARGQSKQRKRKQRQKRT